MPTTTRKPTRSGMRPGVPTAPPRSSRIGRSKPSTTTSRFSRTSTPTTAGRFGRTATKPKAKPSRGLSRPFAKKAAKTSFLSKVMQKAPKPLLALGGLAAAGAAAKKARDRGKTEEPTPMTGMDTTATTTSMPTNATPMPTNTTPPAPGNV